MLKESDLGALEGKRICTIYNLEIVEEEVVYCDKEIICGSLWVEFKSDPEEEKGGNRCVKYLCVSKDVAIKEIQRICRREITRKRGEIKKLEKHMERFEIVPNTDVSFPELILVPEL